MQGSSALDGTFTTMQRDTLRNLLVASAIFISVMWIGPQLLADTAAAFWVAGATDSDRADGNGVAANHAHQASRRVPYHRPPRRPPLPRCSRHARRTIEQDLRRWRRSFQWRRRSSRPKAPIACAWSFPTWGRRSPPRRSRITRKTSVSRNRYMLLDTFEDGDGRKMRSLAIESVTIDNEVVSVQDKKWHSDGPKPTSDKPGQQVIFTLDIEGDRRTCRSVGTQVHAP